MTATKQTVYFVAALLLVAPDEGARRHVEEITASTFDYRVVQGGTMDGENCRSPIGGGFGIWTQTWESNRSVRLENVGDTDVVNPWLSNGRNDFRTMKEIVAGAVKPGMTDRERAMSIWRRQTTHRFHASAGDQAEMHDPVKVYNVYGYTTCGDDSVCLAGLWHEAGFPVSPGRLLGHRTSEVFYDGRWHLMDGDLGPVYLLRDNVTIASEQDLVRDHDLVKRSHPHGILDPDRRASNEEHAAVFVSEGAAAAGVPIARSSTMAMTLRPGEAIVWRWGKGTKYHGHEDLRTWGPRKGDGCVWGAEAADRVCNGLWEYRPDLKKPGPLVWRMRSPYPFVGGRLEVSGSGAKFFLSWDGREWQPASENLDAFFPAKGPARYEYRLKCEGLPERLAILNDLQMAPLAMPGMRIGENRFRYTDESPSRKVRITHDWVERSDTHPPAAPTDGVHQGLAFEWRPSEGAEDYHFILSERPDFAWPLSSNFEKLISNTADRGRARYRLPSEGLLNPGQTYYWRVRARNAVWGPWSRTWSFTAGGPSVPLDVRIENGVLRWTSTAKRHRIYGSDEKGFSASDDLSFIRETDKAEFALQGRAFYRVVAVDASGARSGPSDYASAPRPAFFGDPPGTAGVGVKYEGRLSTVRSEGDLRLQWVDGKEVARYWDREQPLFSISRGPAWLRIDPRSGALSGVPDAKGAFEVVVSVVLERSVRRLEDPGPRPWNLGLGKDKTVDIVTERSETAERRFQISVGE